MGPPCADAVAFLKPTGITAEKAPPLVVTRPEDDVVVDPLLKLAVIAVVFDEVAVGVVADAAAERDGDEADPQPAKASAAVVASATAPYRIDDRESAMLTGVAPWREEGVGAPRSPSPVPLSGSEGMATGSPPERRRGRGHGSRPPPQRCRPTPPEVSPHAFRSRMLTVAYSATRPHRSEDAGPSGRDHPGKLVGRPLVSFRFLAPDGSAGSRPCPDRCAGPRPRSGRRWPRAGAGPRAAAAPSATARGSCLSPRRSAARTFGRSSRRARRDL